MEAWYQKTTRRYQLKTTTDNSFLYDNRHNLFRADGRGFDARCKGGPYNGYFWPTESWWLGHEHRSYASDWNFGYVELQDNPLLKKLKYSRFANSLIANRYPVH